MKIATIDLGTNTFHLLIAEIDHIEPKIIYKTNVPVKLGEDITKDNLIIPAAFERGINCLMEFNATIQEYKVNKIKAVATSGVRSAKNGQAFVDAAKNNANIEIEVIGGDEEAAYIYQGVKWSGAITDCSLIMDIGGGSTEFIVCDSHKLFWKKSYNVGAARLMQHFFKSDPINEIDQKAIESHLDLLLQDLLVICKKYKPRTLIGSAGAFESYASIINPNLDIKQIATSIIDLKAYQALSVKLINANHEERSQIPGLIPLRTDMIVMASLLTNYVLTNIHVDILKLSTYDLKMGVLKSLEI